MCSLPARTGSRDRTETQKEAAYYLYGAIRAGETDRDSMKRYDDFGTRPDEALRASDRLREAARHSANPLVQLCRIADVRPDARSDTDFHPDTAYEPKCMPKFRQAGIQRLREFRIDPASPMDAQVQVWVPGDRMQAWAAVFPPLNGGRGVTMDMIERALTAAGVQAGLKAEALDALLDEETGYMRLTCVAQGLPAKRGADGVAISLVRQQETPWAVDNWDRVDYAEQSWIRLVEAGQKLGQITRPGPGKDGYDVTGARLEGRPGRPCANAAGQNTHFSEDGTYVLASTDGHVTDAGGRFRVHEILHVHGDVDYETGNIRFRGTVIVDGNVRPRFRVEADGDVIVRGTVENGYVTGGHNVTIWGGALGARTGRIDAARDLRCKFMENGRAYVGGNAQFETLIQSTVSCGGTIDVTTGRGVVIGGSLTAMGDIRVRAAGNRSFRATMLTVGPTEEFLSRKRRCIQQLQATRSQLASVKAGMKPLLEYKQNPRVAEVLTRQAGVFLELQQRLEDLAKQTADFQLISQSIRRHRVYASYAYPNVRVRIDGSAKRLRQECVGGVFALRDGEVENLHEAEDE